MIDEAIRERLLDLARRDAATRERLAAGGSLFDGYHPEMQAVHEANAAELRAVIGDRGWPGRRLAGEDGAQAAWLIVQHAIGLPDFQRSCLARLDAAAAQGDAPAWQAAYLVDRIRALEGREQIYGTQFDWDEAGEMRPLPIEEPDTVDARRAAAGLAPLAEAVAEQQRAARTQPKPEDPAARRERMEDWARQVGWR